MNLPISWLKEYVSIVCDTNTFCDKMTLSGSKVECVTNKGENISNVVVGKVLSIEKHPDADKLVVVMTDIGKDEPIQIVTGADNLFVGAYVPVALHKATLSGGLKIKKSKIRGVESNGMFCSVEEFGFTRDDYPEAPENGIYIFKEEQALGSCVKKILQLDEDVVEFEITSNRPDCFSIIGLAREASATFDLPLNIPKIEVLEDSESIDNKISINIEDNLCKRYTCRIIKDVKIEKSPQWLRQRLTASGIRPINNIVDITNYVMLEFGQPMHAYDLNKINGTKLNIRKAKNGETLDTLDGEKRVFDDSILVIEDDNGIIDLAGIMGGKNTMVTDSTTDILLESASFDGTHIRLSSKKLGLRTDASSKYEKGLDENLCMVALDRACMLINMLNCGKVLSGAIDIYKNKIKEHIVPYNSDRINKLLGTDISKDDMIKILEKLDINHNEQGAIIKTFRPDLQNEADIAEEVARIYGYDKIKPTLAASSSNVGKLSYKQTVIQHIISSMVQNGLSQSLNYSFESPKVFDKLNIAKDDILRNTVNISNPLGEDFSIMRTTTINGMLNNLSINYNRRNKEAHLFEIGKIYIPNESTLNSLPTEKEILTIGMYGNIDFYYIKGVVENLLDTLNIKNSEYIPEENIPFMHPYRSANIVCGNNIGYVGEVHKQISDRYNIETRAYVCVLYIDELINLSNYSRKYRPLPKYPAIQRDIAIIIDENINVAEIEKIIKKKGSNLLENISLFDIYKGEQIEKGYKSVAYNITFRSNEKTLVDDDVNKPIQNIIDELSNKLNATLRS